MTDRLERARSLVESGDHGEAWSELARAMMEDASTSVCHAVADLSQQVDAGPAGAVRMRAALLTNYTAEPLVPILQACAVTSGVQLAVHVPAFDTWMQELVAGDGPLRAFDPEVVFLDLHGDAFCPRLTREFLGVADEAAAYVDDAAERIRAAAAALRAWSRARLVVHLVPEPHHPVLGILDDGERSQRGAVRALNDRIRALAGERSGVWCLDTDRLVAAVGAERWHERRLWLLAKIPYTAAAMLAIADAQVRYVRAFAGRARKVLVLDLDNTLWGGVLGERGLDGLQLGPTYPGSAFVDVQIAAREWLRRGVVLALNSSNDDVEALAAIDSHPEMRLRTSDFAARRINWQDKAQNLVELSDELGLDLDSFVYVDDNAAECARVRQALPQVITVHLDGPPFGFAARIRSLGVFDSLSYTGEDRHRTALYRTQVQRVELKNAIGSLDEYLASLDMELRVDAIGLATAGRAAVLTQRTNQFNMTVRRRTAADILAAVEDGRADAYVFSLRDRFGDEGVIGFAAIDSGDAGEMHITDFLVSCRVLKRGIEQAMLHVLVARARERGASRVVAQYRPTKKNAPFAAFYADAGFALRHAGGDLQEFVRAAGDPLPAAAHVRIVRGAPQKAEV
jgi:FkbH-like protein